MNTRHFVLALLTPVVLQGQSWVADLSPSPHSLTSGTADPIRITFSRSIDPATLNDSTLHVFGSQSGRHSLTIDYDSTNLTAAVVRQRISFPGELMRIVLTGEVKDRGGVSMPPFSASFRVGVRSGSMSYDVQRSESFGPGNEMIVLHDWNEDDTVEAVIADRNNFMLILYPHPGGPWGADLGYGYLAAPPMTVSVGDIDRNERSEFAVTYNLSGLVTILEHASGVKYDIRTSLEAGTRASGTVMGDLDADGWTDLLALRDDVDSVNIFFNEAGVFSSSPLALYAISPSAVVVTDLDADGDEDIAVAENTAGTIRFYFQEGSRIFRDGGRVTVGAGPYRMATGDLDGDGWPDLVTVDRTGQSISTVWNSGPTSPFIATTRPSEVSSPISLVLFDGDADGDLDMGVIGNSRKHLKVLRNEGNRSFVPRITYDLGYIASDVHAADLDRDGDLDLYVSQNDRNEFLYFRNRPPVPRIAVQEDTVKFYGGWLDSTAGRQLKISNVGGTEWLVAHLAVEGHGSFSVIPDSLIIAPDDTVSVMVEFRPSTSRDVSGTLVVTSNDSSRSSIRVALIGSGFPTTSVSPIGQVAWSPAPISCSVVFADPMTTSSVTPELLRVIGSQSGRHGVSNIRWEGDGRSMTFDVARPFLLEENVVATIRVGARRADGTSLTKPFTWEFRLRATHGTMVFDKPKIVESGLSGLMDIQVGDLQGDGNADLVVQHGDKDASIGWNGSMVSLFWGRGDSLQYDGGRGWLSGGITFGDFDHELGVGIIGCNWERVVHMWWGIDPNVGVAMLTYKDLDPLQWTFHGAVPIDIDDDGDQDYISAHLWRHFVEVNRNDGGLTFKRLGEQLLYIGPLTLALSDLDGDGERELIVAGRGDETISICRVQANGAITELRRIPASPGVYAMTVAELNGDGRPDILASGWEGGEIVALINEGSFTFRRTVVPLDGGTPTAVVTADFDGNGTMDVAASAGGFAHVWSNNGSGDLVRMAKVPVGSSATGIAVIDLHNDGDADLAVSVDNRLVVLVNKPPTPDIDVLRDVITFPNLALGSTVSKVLRIANTGGQGDLIISSLASDHPAISASISSPTIPIRDTSDAIVTFSPTTPAWTLDTVWVVSNDPATPRIPVLIIGGGRPVIGIDPSPVQTVPRSRDSITLNLAVGIASGTMSGSSVRVTSSHRPIGPASVDRSYLSGSESIMVSGLSPGRAGEKIMVTLTPGLRLLHGAPLSPYSTSIQVRPWSGTGGFTKGTTFSALYPSSPILRDFDGDGDLDLAYTDPHYDELVTLRNNGSGTFSGNQAFDNLSTAHTVASADMDGDGDLDLVVAHGGYDNAVTVVLNNGSGGFAAQPTMYLPLEVGGLNLADINSDGDTDIFVLSGYGPAIYLDNIGGASFNGYYTDLQGSRIAVSDLDDDGLPDIVTADAGGWVRVYSNEGLVTFSKRTEMRVLMEGSGLGVEDVDGDGLIDIVLGGRSMQGHGAVAIIRNDSAWRYSLVGESVVSGSPWDIVVADFDADGDHDVATVSPDRDSLTIVENKGAGRFVTVRRQHAGSEPTGLTAGDIDGDGDIDLCSVAYISGKITFYHNGSAVAGVDEQGVTPQTFALHQNFPNPFNPSTTFRFDVPARSRVRLEVFNTLGQRVAVIMDEETGPGVFERSWTPTGASGVYFCRMDASDASDPSRRYRDVKRILFLR